MERKKIRCLSQARAIAKTISRYGKRAVRQLLWEIPYWVAVLGIGSLLIAWGIPSDVASFIALTIAYILAGAFLFAIYFLFGSRQKGIHRGNKKQVEIRLARWISQVFADRKSTAWTEYQDWLHDIMLSRRQLLDASCPRWKVSLITYWRLSTFFLMVGISKVRRVTAKLWRSR